MIPAPLRALILILGGLQCGNSLHGVLKGVTEKDRDPFMAELRIWLFRFESGGQNHDLLRGLSRLGKTPVRIALLQIIEAGLHGSPVAKPLGTLRDECFERCELEYERRLQMLPLKLLIPLLLGFFPAILCLLLGPILYTITHQLGALP